MKEADGNGLVGYMVPESKNSATPITNFQDRDFIDYNEDTSQTVDLRTQKSLFARVDEDNNAIYPNIEKVKFDPDLKVFGFDFVLTLVKQFATEWQSVNNQISQFSVYKNAAFTNKNFRSIDEAFQNYYNELFEDFRRELFDTGEEVSVIDFDSYVSKFMHFIKRTNAPITRESLIRTRLFDPHNCLLIYNLQDESHGDDEKTVVDYYQDVSFRVFGDFLIHHGLVLDRHSPWRFVVNIKSPQVQTPSKDRKMPWEQISTTKLLSNYFIPAFKTEAGKMRELLVSNYNAFVPLANKKAVSQCASTLKPLQKDVNRNFADYGPSTNLSVINFLIAARENETKKSLTTSMRSKVITELQTNMDDINVAYKCLHLLMKQRQLYKPPTNLNRVDALVVANYLRCESAHRSSATGTWIPCKTPSEFFSKVKDKKGAPELLENLLANINKEEIEEYQEQILDSLDPF